MLIWDSAMNKYILLLITLASINNLYAAEIKSLELSPTTPESNYQEIIISGSGFGAGPNIIVADDFDNQTAGAAVDLKKAIIGQWERSSSYPELPIIVNNEDGKAIEVRNKQNTGTASIAQIETILPAATNSVFVSYSVMVPEGSFFSGASEDYKFPDMSSWKFTWITDTPLGIASQTKFNICTPTHAGKGAFLLAGNSVNHGYVGVSGAWSWHTKNYMSFGIRANETLVRGIGSLYFQLSGKKNSTLVFQKDTQIFPDSNTTSFDRVKFPGWFGNGDQSKFNAYYDDLYVAAGKNAFARVELSNGALLEESTVNVTLPVVSWTDTTIVAKVNKNLLKTEPIYLRVYDSNNSGLIKKLICNKCPLPPVPLKP